MIPDQRRQEDLSRAYLAAVVANAGWTHTVHTPDYGIDSTIQYIEKRGSDYLPTGHDLAVQMKSTTSARCQGGYMVYDLEVRAYNHLVEVDVGTPRILVLYCMPKNQAQWLSINKASSTLRRRGYWIALRGQPVSTNSSSQRIRIPLSNVFDCAALSGIMGRLRAGGLP